MKPHPTCRFTPYPAISRHGVIGDRRTAALIAADGSVDWLCLPDYDGAPLFAALVDAEHGGRWRLGPRTPSAGRQRYVPDSAVLETVWSSDGELELTDFMPWPADAREPGRTDERVLVRRLRCLSGRFECALEYVPRSAADDVSLFSTAPLEAGRASFTLEAGQEVWAALSRPARSDWSVALLQRLLEETTEWWTTWSGRFARRQPSSPLTRSLLTMHLCSYAPSGSMVAAPTSSLPERIGGDRNYDYRFAWIRDASLCLDCFARLDDTTTAQRFLDWLCGLGSSTASPLQVAYGIRGETHLAEREERGWPGYRGSLPVRVGNRAYSQRQIGSLGYLADAMLQFVEHGGQWNNELSALLTKLAEHTCGDWQKADSGVWELSEHKQYVSSKVMCWVVLDRALRIDERLRFADAARRDRWQAVRARIHHAVVSDGWSEKLHAFREDYDGERLDGGALLIPIMGLLPADDPRVTATVERIGERLSIDGWIYRFDPAAIRDSEHLPLGQLEGAFVPCLFWLATAHALAGRVEEAERVLARGEAAAGELGLFSEEFDPRDGTALGNYPLLFSHAEHVRARLAIDAAVERRDG